MKNEKKPIPIHSPSCGLTELEFHFGNEKQQEQPRLSQFLPPPCAAACPSSSAPSLLSQTLPGAPPGTANTTPAVSRALWGPSSVGRWPQASPEILCATYSPGNTSRETQTEGAAGIPEERELLSARLCSQVLRGALRPL